MHHAACPKPSKYKYNTTLFPLPKDYLWFVSFLMYISVSFKIFSHTLQIDYVYITHKNIIDDWMKERPLIGGYSTEHAQARYWHRASQICVCQAISAPVRGYIFQNVGLLSCDENLKPAGCMYNTGLHVGAQRNTRGVQGHTHRRCKVTTKNNDRIFVSFGVRYKKKEVLFLSLCL